MCIACSGEVGAEHLAVLHIHEHAVRVAGVAVIQNLSLVTVGQGEGIDFHHVGKRRDSINAVLPLNVRDGGGLVFQQHANPGNSRFIQVLFAVSVAIGEHLADDKALITEDAAEHQHRGRSRVRFGGPGSGGDEVGIRAQGRRCPHLHAVSDIDFGIWWDGSKGEDQVWTFSTCGIRRQCRLDACGTQLIGEAAR